MSAPRRGITGVDCTLEVAIRIQHKVSIPSTTLTFGSTEDIVTYIENQLKEAIRNQINVDLDMRNVSMRFLYD
jgi:hypothetical protein